MRRFYFLLIFSFFVIHKTKYLLKYIFCSVTIQIKAIEQYFPVVLFIMLYKVVLTFEFVHEVLKCVHLTESY